MDVTGEENSGIYFVKVDAPRIDAAGAVQFKDSFREAISDVDGRIVLDLSQVDFLDSSGLGAVVAAMKLLGPDRRLEISGLTPTVQKVFRLTRMDSVFKIHANRDAATADPSNA